MRVIIKPGGLFALAVVLVVIVGGVIFLTQNGRGGNSGGAEVAANNPSPVPSVSASPFAAPAVSISNPNNLVNGGEWKFYTEDTAHASQAPLGPGHAPAQPAYRFTVDQIGKKEWNIGFNRTITGASFRSDEKVRLRFRGRSPKSCLITALMQKNLAPFPHCWKQDIRLTPDWKEYDFTFPTDAYGNGEAILAFFFGHEVGVCELAGISLERTH